MVAYNRPEALARILQSLAGANYVNYSDIRLIISIDGGGNRNQEVKQAANSFVWVYGEKEIIEHQENLGLRDHVIFCIDLTDKYDNLIILEDDNFVSINFYDFAIQALSFYNNDTHIAGISLYAYQYYESFNTVFIPLADGYDTYFMQVPSSLGQIWTKRQWSAFKFWYNTNPSIEPKDKIPEKVKTWPESSWKKYFYKYMVEKNLFFVFPQIAFTTNFGDAGTHFSSQTQIYQVALEYYEKGKRYNFLSFDQSFNKYDSYFELLSECLIARNVDIDPNTCIDLMGSKPLHLFTNKYALSSKRCLTPIKSYDCVLIPFVMNILYQIEGNVLHYGLHDNFRELHSETSLMQMANAQSIGYYAGRNHITSGKYYKLGYYLSNPSKIPNYLKRKLLKCYLLHSIIQ